MSEPLNPLQPIQELIKLHQEFVESLVNQLATILGNTPEAKLLSAAVITDLSRILPPPFNTVMFMASKNVLAEIDASLASTLSTILSSVTLITQALTALPLTTILTMFKFGG